MLDKHKVQQQKVQENVNLIEERRQKTGLNVKDVKLMVKKKS